MIPSAGDLDRRMLKVEILAAINKLRIVYI